MKYYLALPLMFFLTIFLGACDAGGMPLPGARKAIFRDDFVQGFTGNWQLEADEIGSTSIVPEQLLIEIESPNMIQYAMLAEPTFSDFELEVEAGLYNGTLTSTYGVLFRMQSPTEFYRFAITGDGMFILERHDANGASIILTDDWRDSAAINKGYGATNVFKIDANGPRLGIYINDALLQEVTDDSYRAGNIALSAGTFDGSGTQVSFDNLNVYPPR